MGSFKNYVTPAEGRGELGDAERGDKVRPLNASELLL